MKNWKKYLIVVLFILIIAISFFIINKPKNCSNEAIEINFIANCPIAKSDTITPLQINTFFHLFNNDLNPVITFKRKDLMDSNIDSVKFISNLNETKCNDIKDVLDKSKKQVRTTTNMYAAIGSSDVDHLNNYVTFYLKKGISNPDIEKKEFPFEQPELLRAHIDKELKNSTLFEKNEAKKINIVILCGNGENPPPPPPCSDKDRDGVCDEDDECETVPGPRSNKGCPSQPDDRDGDGVLDTDDNCPTKYGPRENNGCPWPDTDDDGVPDKDDDCRYEKGPRENNGCAWPDGDDDGVPDKDDRCPYVKGSRSNNGCPEDIKVSFNKSKLIVNEGSADSGNSNTFKWTNLNSSNCKKIEFTIYLKSDEDTKIKYTIKGEDITKGVFEFDPRDGRFAAVRCKVKMKIDYKDGYKGEEDITKRESYFFHCSR